MHSKLVLTLGSLMYPVVVPYANEQLTLMSCVDLSRRVTHPGPQMHLHREYPLQEVVVMKVVSSLKALLTLVVMISIKLP